MSTIFVPRPLTTRRPIATLSSQGITLFGGAGLLDDALSDDSDATFARQSDGSYGRVRFGNVVLPAGAIVYTVTLKLRARRAVDNAIINASLNGGVVGQLHPPTGGTYLTLSSVPLAAITAAQLAAGIVLDWNASGGQVDISEAYLDVVYTVRPVVTVTGPTGTIGVTQPTVEWQTAAASPQSRYQIKVFSQAQFEGAGFNPAGSRALFDSGVQVGGTNSLTPLVSLVNGGTYRFYVRAAQQVGAQTQYSDWSFSTATVSAIPPPVPTVTPVADNVNARVKLTVVDSTTTGGGGGAYGSGPYGSGPYGGGVGGFAATGGVWKYVTVERSNDGGATWTVVRSVNHTQVFGESFVAYDYESCNGELVQYRARAIGSLGGQDISSDWSAVSAAVAWSSTKTWLKSLTEPTINMTLSIKEVPTLKRRNPQGVFDIPDRTDPIVVSSGRKLSEGTVTFLTMTVQELAGLEQLLNRSEVLLLQTPAVDGWGCKYIACGDVDENRVSRLARHPHRDVVVPFLEVLSPVGEVIGFGVTYNDIAAQYPTYADLAASGLSYNALAGRV